MDNHHQEQQLLVIKPTFGLGNCLRLISTAMWLADRTGRRLIIVNPTTKYKYAVADMLDWRAMDIECVDSYECVGLNAESARFTFIENPLPVLDFFTRDVTIIINNCTNHKIVYVEFQFAMAIPAEFSPQYDCAYVEMRRTYYRRLIFKQRIRNDFAAFANTYLPAGPFMAIHVRRDDLQQFQLSAENYDVKEYIKTALALSHPSPVDNSHQLPWYLLTDDDYVRREFGVLCVDKYTPVMIPASFRNGNEALLDFMILASSQKIVATYSSSFGVEAFFFSPNNTATELCVVGHVRHPFHVPYISYATGSPLASYYIGAIIFAVMIFLMLFVLMSSHKNRVNKHALVMLAICTFLIFASIITQPFLDKLLGCPPRHIKYFR